MIQQSEPLAMLTQEQKERCVSLYVNTNLDFDDIAEIVGADEDEVKEYLEGAEPEKRYWVSIM